MLNGSGVISSLFIIKLSGSAIGVKDESSVNEISLSSSTRVTWGNRYVFLFVVFIIQVVFY